MLSYRARMSMKIHTETLIELAETFPLRCHFLSALPGEGRFPGDFHSRVQTRGHHARLREWTIPWPLSTHHRRDGFGGGALHGDQRQLAWRPFGCASLRSDLLAGCSYATESKRQSPPLWGLLFAAPAAIGPVLPIHHFTRTLPRRDYRRRFPLWRQLRVVEWQLHGSHSLLGSVVTVAVVHGFYCRRVGSRALDGVVLAASARRVVPVGAVREQLGTAVL
jgi:hypothetical protein